MEDVQQRINDIEKEMRETPYHKGTEHLFGKLRARLAILKAKISDGRSKKGGGGRESGFAVAKHGDATAVLVGFPSVGKSTLLNKLTTAHSRTAEYAFTTVSVIPGMMKYNGANIQIFDVPGLVEGAAHGKGRGREVLSVVRSADLLVIMVEAGKETDIDRIEQELYENGVRIDMEPSRVEIKKTDRGGVHIIPTVKQDLSTETIREVISEFRIGNAEVLLKENVTLDKLIDGLVKNRVYVKAVYVSNKVDLHPRKRQSSRDIIPISAEKGIGLDKLREALWKTLGLIRVYLKEPGWEINYDEPLIVKKGSNINDVSQKVGAGFMEGRSTARIWGSGARFPGQMVSLSTPIEDGMEIMFI